MLFYVPYHTLPAVHLVGKEPSSYPLTSCAWIPLYVSCGYFISRCSSVYAI